MREDVRWMNLSCNLKNIQFRNHSDGSKGNSVSHNTSIFVFYGFCEDCSSRFKRHSQPNLSTAVGKLFFHNFRSSAFFSPSSKPKNKPESKSDEVDDQELSRYVNFF